MQPSPYMPGSYSRVTEQGSHLDTETLLDREVHRSTSITNPFIVIMLWNVHWHFWRHYWELTPPTSDIKKC